MEIVTPIVIAVLLIVGSAVHYFAGEPDTCAEEIVEQVLRIEGVDIDFSAYDKRVAKEAAEKQKAEEAAKAKALVSAGE